MIELDVEHLHVELLDYKCEFECNSVGIYDL